KIAALTTDGVFSEYPVTGVPRGLVTIPSRALAFAEWTASGGFGYATVGGAVSEYPGLDLPMDVVFGPDGRIWFSQYQASSLFAMHFFANAPPTETIALVSHAQGLTVGLDGRIWAAEPDAQQIEACSPWTGSCDPFPVSGSPYFIAAGPDGSIWFTEGV